MRKKIALFLAAIMVVGTLPMTAFAKTSNEIDRVVTVQDNAQFTTQLIIDDIDTETTPSTIKVVLTNAEFKSGNALGANDFTFKAGCVTGTPVIDQYSKTKAFVTFKAAGTDPVVMDIALKAKGEGEATLTIEDVDSDVTEETLKIANIVDGATVTTIDGTTPLKEGVTEIKEIVIEEVVKGTLENGELIKLRLAGGFEWATTPSPITSKIGGVTLTLDSVDGRDAYYKVAGAPTSTAAVIVLDGFEVTYDVDDVDFGTDCEVIVSGAGVDKTTLLVGTASDYGVTFTAEDKDLPQIWAGEAEAEDALKVTIKEVIADSWIDSRKAKITLTEGVKVANIDATNITCSLNPDKDVITLSNFTSDKAEIELDLVAAADFEGEVEATLSGTATGEDDQTVVIATVAQKLAVDADTNELVIDYRNTEASDIVITEAEAGLWEKGEVIALKLDGIDFEGKPSVTVEEGDMKIHKVDENKGVISFEVKQESIKDAAVIRISGVELYMHRSLPAGEYDLALVQYDETKDPITDEVDDVVFENDELYGNDNFDVDDITVCEGYVTIVTAGRDQDDSTFTTKVAVTIGAAEMTAGSQVIALDVPAFIDGGYTMLPVRAVAEALSDAAIVKWDDATKTVVIFFGQRTISMTIGSKVMVINGVDVAMSAAPVIVNGRTFLPLRDLGYALGLSEEKIAWDDATKTATLN